MKKCIILQKHGTYETYFQFAKKLASGFAELGLEVIEIEFNNLPPDSQYNEQSLQALLDNLPGSDFVLSFNGYGNDLVTAEGESLYDLCGVPFISVLADDPAWDKVQSGTRLDRQIFTCIDKTHVDMLKEAYAQPEAVFVPHGGTVSDSFKQLSFHDRPVDVLFAGTYVSAQGLLDNSALLASPNAKKLFSHIAEKITASEAVSYYEAVKTCVKEDLGLRLEGDKLRQYVEAFRSAMDYVRYLRRDRLLTQILQAGIQIECYGTDWDKSPFCSYHNFAVHKPVNYNETLELMNHSKLVLNCSPMWTHGSHERVFSAMCNGAVALTNTSMFFEQVLTDNENAVVYSFMELDALPDKISLILTDPSLFKAISENGRELALSSYMWSHAAERILVETSIC